MCFSTRPRDASIIASPIYSSATLVFAFSLSEPRPPSTLTTSAAACRSVATSDTCRSARTYLKDVSSNARRRTCVARPSALHSCNEPLDDVGSLEDIAIGVRADRSGNEAEILGHQLYSRVSVKGLETTKRKQRYLPGRTRGRAAFHRRRAPTLS